MCNGSAASAWLTSCADRLLEAEGREERERRSWDPGTPEAEACVVCECGTKRFAAVMKPLLKERREINQEQFHSRGSIFPKPFLRALHFLRFFEETLKRTARDCQLKR
jgi:hypothetical protein